MNQRQPNKQYNNDYKTEAVKLALETGTSKAAVEPGISKNTLYGWVKAQRKGTADLGTGMHTPKSAMTINEELIGANRRIRELEKENRRLEKENAFLEEASAFFAASRRKSKKTNE